nr:MAG TPA: hypothetical protein [Caudoviricetes sp.]
MYRTISVLLVHKNLINLQTYPQKKELSTKKVIHNLTNSKILLISCA